jgi:hypothetical protein
MFVTSSISSMTMLGNIVGAHRASSVFPAPGGPLIRILCPQFQHGI